MNPLNLNDVQTYVENNIGIFHQKRIQSIETLKLKNILKRKNPYLYKAKNVLTADEIIKGIVNAHISSSEEGIFGDWLEGLAIYINNLVYGGWKSGIQGIDLEFNDDDNKRYIVNIKSGSHWGNSSQINKMKTDFISAKRTLRTSNSRINVIAINGCCYGIDNKFDKGDYLKMCGQRFWTLISGNDNLYKEIIEPLGYRAREKNDEFIASYSSVINRFTNEFTNDYCNTNGSINWDRIIELNSKQKD